MTSLVLLSLFLTCPEPGDPSSRPSIHGWTAAGILDSIVLTRAANNMLRGDPGDDDYMRPDLVLICGNRRISASVHGVPWKPRGSPVSIPLSLDGGPFVETGIDGGLAAFFFNRPKAVIRQLLQHHDLVVRVRPDGQPESLDIHFELDGLDRVIWPLADACGWDPSKSDGEEVPNASQ